MEGIRSDSPTARVLAEALGEARFNLIDVGCSGGLDAGWQVFGDRLRAYGFDPSTFEIGRLSRAETRPEVHYLNAFVALPDGHPLKGAAPDAWVTNPWRRVSAYRTQTLQQRRAAAVPQPAPPPLPPPDVVPEATAPAAPAAAVPPPPPLAGPGAAEPLQPAPPAEQAAADQDLMRRNLWHKAVLSDGSVHLPDFLREVGFKDLDFVKIDVDGADFEVLQSLDGLFGAQQILGVSIEVGYSGVGDPGENSFHNVDRFMRGQGFDLFDLTVRRYALAALPFPFLYPHPIAAQTTRGRPLIGDALYLRDFGHRSPQSASHWSDDKLIKLCALYCLFGLPDHAAELLDLFGDRLAARLDVAALRESVTAEIQDIDPDLHGDAPRFASHADYLAAYEADAPYFYGAEGRLHDRRMQAVIQRDEAWAALAAAHAAHGQTLAELEQAGAAVEALVKEREAVSRTLSWRITAPLRGLRRLLRRRA